MMFETASVPDNLFDWDDWKRFHAVEAPSKESQNSKLPGREDGPAPVDATGRIIDDGSLIWSGSGVAGGSVHVRAHSRAGGKVAVSAYDRSAPSG